MTRNSSNISPQKVLNARMVAIVVGEFYQWQDLVSTALKVQNTSPQHILQCLYSPFGLALHLWIIGSDETQLNTHSLLQCFPNLQNEARVLIRYYRSWNSVQSYYLLDV